MTHTHEQAIELMKAMQYEYCKLLTSTGKVANNNIAKITYELLSFGKAYTTVCKNRQQNCYGSKIIGLLKKVGIEATLQNDAPRGGKIGDFIQI